MCGAAAILFGKRIDSSGQKKNLIGFWRSIRTTTRHTTITTMQCKKNNRHTARLPVQPRGKNQKKANNNELAKKVVGGTS